jgi:mannose-6-phosphate isomerase-like protein (cupin superfamily)
MQTALGMQFLVYQFEDARFTVPHGHEKNSRGFERTSLIDRSHGSVHMGVGVCRLQSGGHTASFLHANEKGIYVFEGELDLRCGDTVCKLGTEDYALIPYGTVQAFRNRGSTPVRWIEMQAPQPKPAGGWQDMYFVEDFAWPAEVNAPDFAEAHTKFLGHFTEKNPTINTRLGAHGLHVHRFIERNLGSEHFYMMRGVLQPGGVCDYHDHPVEEFYIGLSGTCDMEIEGQRFHLKAGTVVWTGVGTRHAFYQTGSEPFRWIETQAPQFPAQHGLRNHLEWEQRFKTKRA